MIKLTELFQEASNFDEREYSSMLYQAEKPHLNDENALAQLVAIYERHLREMNVFLNNAKRGIKN
jgi:hypothetical protein